MMRSNYTVNVTPRFQVFSADQVDEMHYGTLEVLRRTGVKVLVAEAREMLKKAGCWIDGEIVRFPPHLVEWAIRTAPSRVVLCDRDGQPAMDLEGYKTYFGTGSDCLNVIDPYTGERRQGRLQDVANFARLADALPNIEFRVIDSDRNILYSNKSRDYNRSWDFRLEASQQLKIFVKVPSEDGIPDDLVSGCVAIMFGFQEN